MFFVPLSSHSNLFSNHTSLPSSYFQTTTSIHLLHQKYFQTTTYPPSQIINPPSSHCPSCSFHSSNSSGYHSTLPIRPPFSQAQHDLHRQLLLGSCPNLLLLQLLRLQNLLIDHQTSPLSQIPPRHYQRNFQPLLLLTYSQSYSHET